MARWPGCRTTFALLNARPSARLDVVAAAWARLAAQLSESSDEEELVDRAFLTSGGSATLD